MNPSNLQLPDKKAANRGVAGKSAIATKSVIVTNKAVAAKSASATNKAVAANRVVAAKSAAANEAVSKATDDKPSQGRPKALGDCALH
jgi:hypothetical protein